MGSDLYMSPPPPTQYVLVTSGNPDAAGPWAVYQYQADRIIPGASPFWTLSDHGRMLTVGVALELPSGFRLRPAVSHCLRDDSGAWVKQVTPSDMAALREGRVPGKALYRLPEDPDDLKAWLTAVSGTSAPRWVRGWAPVIDAIKSNQVEGR